MTGEKTIEVRPYFAWQIAELYYTDTKTLAKWLKPFEDQIGERTTRKFTVKQVTIIFECLGSPS